MRGIFSLVGLLIVVAIVGLAAKKMLASGVAPHAPAAAAAVEGAPVLAGTPKQQVEQFKQAAEAAVQQARPMPTDDK